MAKQNKFGTFGGVFVPSILTILGVIMYLRLPFIVGEAGLWATLGIIIVAHIISATTGLSVSSIATDKKVEAGGTYYMISRSLGLPIGGTLGLALFVGLSFSVSLYLIGFSESFLNYLEISTDINNIRLTGSIILLAVTTLTFISTSLAMKTQYFIMAAIGLSLISIFLGNFLGHEYVPSAPTLLKDPDSTIPLMVLFGIFFPAVTGFEAGVSMSGDLQDPKKSIPRGSIMAIVVGLVVYIILTFFLAYTVDGTALRNDKSLLLSISWVPELVIAGIWGATLSSALGSILGAPRILQATAVDKISHKWFAKGYGATNEPRNALLFTFVIAETGILIGELDVIARIVSIFFITTYGFLNISAVFEKWTSTDFRPEFKVSGWFSVIGAAACLFVMVQLDPLAMFGAVIVLGLLFAYLKRKELTLESGDALSGVWASLVKKGLTKLTKDRLHNRNWRPNIVMFSGLPDSRTHLVEMGKALSGSLGVLSAFNLVKSEDRILAKTESNLADQKEDAGYFEHKLFCRDEYSAMDQIARVYGFSGVEPNTILMGWSKKPGNKERFIDLLENFNHYKYSTVFLNYDQDRGFGDHHTIDIWWSGVGKNLSFAISLMQHIVNSNIWKQSKIRFLVINPINGEAENVYRAVGAILDDFRVEAEIRIVNNETDPLTESEIIKEESKDTDLTIVGVSEHKYVNLDQHYDQITAIIEGIGTTLIINAASDFEEFEVISDSKGKTKSLLQETAIESLVLPELDVSPYSEVATDMAKVDVNGRKVMELFYKKTFQPVMLDHLEVLDQLSEKTGFIGKELDKLTKISDTFRKKKAIDKLKNDFLFKINELFTHNLKETLLPAQLVKLQQGIDWYQNRLRQDFTKYPSKLLISYNDEDFEIKSTDRFSLKTFKRLKKVKHSIFGKPITNEVNYREVARFYQLNNRQVFLDQLLNRFEEEVVKFYNDLRKTTNATIAYLDEIERQIWIDSNQWQDKKKLEEIEFAIEQEAQNQRDLSKIQLGRLQLEFRKNLQLMGHDLEKVDVDHVIKHKSRSSKYYKKVVESVAGFTEGFDLNIRTLLNMILMEISVNTTKNRIEDIHMEFNNLLKNEVEHKYIKNLDAISAKLAQGEEIDFKKVKLQGGFEVELQQGFTESHERMITLAEGMPETVEIYSAKNEGDGEHQTVAIPVARMAEYYLKSQYEVSVTERFESLMEFIRSSIYASKDILNLTKFNLENEEVNDKDERKAQLEECSSKIETEKNNVLDRVKEYLEYANEHFEKAFDPLSSLKIEDSAEDFSYDLRNFQGKKVLTGISQVSEKVSGFFRSLVIRIFYSRSTGVLLTKKFTKSKELDSFNSRLLDIKEKVSPSEHVLNALPPYYTTLFNGKSNISNDFWVSREEEENDFRQALKRYRQGFTGGLLILGDRNTGKTAFCKYVIQRYLKNYTTYTVFPPVQGTTTERGFETALRKATYKGGNVDQIMSQIDEGSVLVINDLELFWERDANGLEVIKLLERLIDDYGQRILFVVNLNPHAYKLINRMTNFGEKFIENINFTAFNAENLKNLIMRRHRSSGMSIGLAEGEVDLNEVQQAQLFNSYFSYCEGIPGTALNGWLANVQKASSHGLIIQKPDYPSLSGLKDLNEDWIMLLTQFVLHKRLDSEKIERVTQWDHGRVKSVVLAMLRSGIIVEKAKDVYHVDPYIHPFLVKALKDKEIL